MASPAQIIANRDNAQFSTGPKTEQGKQASGRNAFRHGLTGQQIVIPGENAAEYEDMRQGLHASYKPANEAERILVDQIAANSWRLDRAMRVETAYFNKLSEGADNVPNAIAIAFIERPAEIARIQRYITTASNAYHKAIRQLEKTQRDRQSAEYEAAVQAAASKPQPEPIGFVSQNHLSRVESSVPAPMHFAVGAAIPTLDTLETH